MCFFPMFYHTNKKTPQIIRFTVFLLLPFLDAHQEFSIPLKKLTYQLKSLFGNLQFFIGRNDQDFNFRRWGADFS